MNAAFMSRQSSLCELWGIFKFTFFMGSFLPDSGTIPGEAIMVPLPPSTATCNKIRLDLKKLRKKCTGSVTNAALAEKQGKSVSTSKDQGSKLLGQEIEYDEKLKQSFRWFFYQQKKKPPLFHRAKSKVYRVLS